VTVYFRNYLSDRLGCALFRKGSDSRNGINITKADLELQFTSHPIIPIAA
ncbi:uncharacterized, partial [Tachysurus ichikawai]